MAEYVLSRRIVIKYFILRKPDLDTLFARWDCCKSHETGYLRMERRFVDREYLRLTLKETQDPPRAVNPEKKKMYQCHRSLSGTQSVDESWYIQRQGQRINFPSSQLLPSQLEFAANRSFSPYSTMLSRHRNFLSLTKIGNWTRTALSIEGILIDLNQQSDYNYSIYCCDLYSLIHS